MSVDVGSLSWRAGVIGHISERGPTKDLSIKVWVELAQHFQKDFFNIFPIGSYVKTRSVDVGHLGWLVGS